MHRGTGWLLLPCLVAALASVAAARPAAAQWDDNCALLCLDVYTDCIAAVVGGCVYVDCPSGQDCVRGRCCTGSTGSTCSGSCGWSPAGCDSPCVLARSECIAGCVPLIPALWLAAEVNPAVAGPLLGHLAAADQALEQELAGVAPQVLPHLANAKSALQSLVNQQKVDPGTAAALSASIAATETALRRGGLRHCAARMTDPDDLGWIDP